MEASRNWKSERNTYSDKWIVCLLSGCRIHVSIDFIVFCLKFWRKIALLSHKHTWVRSLWWTIVIHVPRCRWVKHFYLWIAQKQWNYWRVRDLFVLKIAKEYIRLCQTLIHFVNHIWCEWIGGAGKRHIKKWQLTEKLINCWALKLAELFHISLRCVIRHTLEMHISIRRNRHAKHEAKLILFTASNVVACFFIAFF